jgi:hypothetical protein
LIGHFNADELASYRAGIVRQRRAVRIEAHLVACAKCSQIDVSLTDLSRVLASIPRPAMPELLSERVEAAIAAEAANRASAGVVPGPEHADSRAPEPVSTPGRPDLPRRARRQRRRWEMPDWSSPWLVRSLAGAAALVILVGGGVMLANMQNRSAPAASAPAPHSPAKSVGFSAAAPLRYEASGRPVYTDAVTSNADYTDANLADGVRRAVASSAQAMPAPNTQASHAAAPTAGGTGAPSLSNGAAQSTPSHVGKFRISQLEACLSVVTDGRAVLLTEVARYLGNPVAIIVLKPAGAVFDVIVVGAACGHSGGDVIRTMSVPRT